MAFDPRLADRLRRLFATRAPAREMKMFGGLAFLVNGAMTVGVIKDELMVRVGKDGWGAALKRPHARPMDFTGRPLTGFVYVAPAGLRTDASLARWIDVSLAVVATLPPRKPRKPRPRPPRP